MIKILKRSVSAFFQLGLSVMFLSCSTNLEDRVKAYEEAHNKHDIDKVMSFYTDDIRFEIVGTWSKVGREQVRQLAEWDAATNSHMEISDIKVSADTVTFRLDEGNDWFRLLGVEVLNYEPCMMIFQDGMLKYLKAELSDVSMIPVQEAWQLMFQWASEERSKELSELMPGGEFMYSADYARRWLSLLSEWRDETNRNY